MRDQYASLAASGYQGIIGLRDIFPRSPEDIPILQGLDRRSLNFGLKTNPIRVQWIFAVMEIEAWFLAEYTHFARIHPNITPERIHTEVGFDPQTDAMEARPHPAEDLNAVYALEGEAYIKTHSVFERTIGALDFMLIYDDMRHVKHLRQLVDAIDAFIATIMT